MVLSSHDVPRHATRYALPLGTDLDAWLRSNGTCIAVDEVAACRRARAATIMMLALPGSAYLYQGEELGLLEVADLPLDRIQDPVFERTGHKLKGRDGCRVPIPWTVAGPSYGFGAGGTWLPQPDWFADYSVEAQRGRDGSFLEFYREALALRRTLVSDDSFTWLETRDPQVLHFARANGWECLINFGTRAIPLPGGRLLLSSSRGTTSELAAEAAVWLRPTEFA